MKKQLLVAFASVFMVCSSQAQTDKFWSTHEGQSDKIVTDKGVARLSFPKSFVLYDLNIDPLRQVLFSMQSATDKNGVIITLPNAEGKLEQFQMFEASNFEPALQAQFPQIRAYSGKGITDKYATLKLSISPQGIQTMIFRTDKENEFIEPYSKDHTVYAVFKSQREKGKLAWTCSTDDKALITDVNAKVGKTGDVNKSSAGQLKTMRLAQSCNGEYSNYFGATSAADVALVLAAFNNTLTRCNGVYEKDLALHLNLVASTTNIIYYTPGTDPYSAMGNWNTELQKAINTTLTGVGTTLAANNAAYDIGHMFGASGGGGNAGCIGCVCVNGTAAGTGSTKGRGITSPADGIPQGDNFDIDYVVHEVGHQLGGNHTFSNTNEGAGVSKEVGSGVTIMGYAGITSQDVAPHSLDIYHEATIEQIQANLAPKACPITTSLAGTNATPVVNPVSNYTIPKSTSFVLTGSATDADAGDALTYCWEQNDDGGTSTGAASNASPTKTIGPNFITWPATASTLRYFPKIQSVIANLQTTNHVGGDAGMKSEALSSVARTLNFRLTVRDNSPYSSVAPIKVGQTAFTDMAVTVSGTAGPFVVTIPTTAVSWTAGTNELVTWNVAGTDGNGVNAAFVDIFLSTDGGFTYPIQLANKVPNNGSSTVTVPDNVGTTNRIMVKGNQNIFFDISNTNFTITTPPSTFAVTGSSEQTVLGCTPATAVYTFNYSVLGGFAGTTTFAASGEPAGSTVDFSPVSMSSTNGAVTMTINGLTGATAGNYNILMTATSGATTMTIPFYLYIGLSDATLTTPADLATGTSNSVSLNWLASVGATSYDVEVATDAAFTTIVSSGNVTTNSYTASGLLDNTDYYWRVKPKNATCTGNFSAAFKFTTGATVCTVFPSTDPALPLAIPDNLPAGATSTFNVPAGMSSITDINVALKIINHTFIGDLTGTLKSPAGTTITLFAQPCIDDYHGPMDVTFDDAGVAGACGATPIGLSGTILPNQALSAFNGQDPTGTWTLFVVDAGAADTGSIESWSLDICSTNLAVAQNSLSNFVLYPNPNKGSFFVQFNSKSNSDIAISVHDLRGRTILSNKYSNTGLISQNVSLNNVQSGIYLVTVQDGDNKIVKRIIVE